MCDFCVRVRAPGTAVLMSALDIVDDDGSTCNACNALLCPLHTPATQKQRGRCNACARTDADMDVDALMPMDISENGDSESGDSDSEEFEPVTTPLSYRHAFGIEYENEDEDEDEQEEEDDVSGDEEEAVAWEYQDDRIEVLDIPEWLREYGVQIDARAAEAGAAVTTTTSTTLSPPFSYYAYTLVPMPVQVPVPVQPVQGTAAHVDAVADDTCSICLDALSRVSVTAVLHCHPAHRFHQPCIDTWLASQPVASCPLCQHRFKFIHTHQPRASLLVN